MDAGLGLREGMGSSLDSTDQGGLSLSIQSSSGKGRRGRSGDGYVQTALMAVMGVISVIGVFGYWELTDEFLAVNGTLSGYPGAYEFLAVDDSREVYQLLLGVSAIVANGLLPLYLMGNAVKDYKKEQSYRIKIPSGVIALSSGFVFYELLRDPNSKQPDFNKASAICAWLSQAWQMIGPFINILNGVVSFFGSPKATCSKDNLKSGGVLFAAFILSNSAVLGYYALMFKGGEANAKDGGIGNLLAAFYGLGALGFMCLVVYATYKYIDSLFNQPLKDSLGYGCAKDLTGCMQKSIFWTLYSFVVGLCVFSVVGPLHAVLEFIAPWSCHMPDQNSTCVPEMISSEAWDEVTGVLLFLAIGGTEIFNVMGAANAVAPMLVAGIGMLFCSSDTSTPSEAVQLLSATISG